MKKYNFKNEKLLSLKNNNISEDNFENKSYQDSGESIISGYMYPLLSVSDKLSKI